MRRTLKSDAVVLKKNNLLDKSRLVTLFTKDLGKIRAFAFGVRKITSRRLGALETGNLIKIEAYKKGDRFYLQETVLLSGFYKIKINPDKHKFMYVFLYLLDKLLPEEEKDEKVFDLTKSFFKTLSEKVFVQSDLDKYLNDLIYLLGFSDEKLKQEKLYKTIEHIINAKLPFDMI